MKAGLLCCACTFVIIASGCGGCRVSIGGTPPAQAVARTGNLVCELSWAETLNRELKSPVTALSGDWFTESSDVKHNELRMGSNEKEFDGVEFGGMKVAELLPSGRATTVFEVYAKKIDERTMAIHVHSSVNYTIAINDANDARVNIIDDSTGKPVQGELLGPGDFVLHAEIAVGSD